MTLLAAEALEVGVVLVVEIVFVLCALFFLCKTKLKSMRSKVVILLVTLTLLCVSNVINIF